MALSANASHHAAVDKASCHQIANKKQPFILVLKSGDNLIQSITQCAQDAKLLAASVSGFGQIQKPTLAYFSSHPEEKPTLTALDGFYELACLNGNIPNNANQYYTHLHGVLADKKFNGIAGHIDSATVGLTVEVTIIPFSTPIERTVNSETAFGLIVTHG